MGADFLMAVAEITKPAQHWYDLLGEMDDGAIDAYVKESDHIGWDDGHEAYWGEEYKGDLATDAERAKFYQFVSDRVNDAITTCYGESRQGSWFSDGEKKWYITGGMSWGDDPTDIFLEVRIMDSFQHFCQLQD
jgi:hypothetical protein